MGLPLPLLAGLGVLVLAEQWDRTLPGEASWWRLALTSVVVLLPFLIARHTAAVLRRSLARGARVPRWLAVVLRLQWLAVPASYAVLVMLGDLPQLAVRVAPESFTGLMLWLGLPLVAMDFGLRRGEARGVRWLELAGRSAPAGYGPDRLRMTAFLATPFLLLAILADVAVLDRRAEVLLLETSIGGSLGLLITGVGLCFALPLIFRVLLPVSRALPPRLAPELYATAERLGFSRRCLLSLNTDHRMVNAALVGPFRWPRYLVLTDGLLSLLDPLALRGVVAHEVGHAKANHPGWLVLVFACLPVLLYHPVLMVDIEEWPQSTTIGLAVAGVVIGWLALRAMAHRFEYEADQLSAEALGGAEACISALRRVGAMTGTDRRRSSFRHPSEARRIRNLLRCESDTGFRQRFWRRGRLMRGTIALVAVISLGFFGWAQMRLWSGDQARYLFYTGRLTEARALLAAEVDDAPATQQVWLRDLSAEIDRIEELGVERSPWRTMREQIAARAAPRALRELENGLETAAPWVGLMLYSPDAAAWQQALYLYCRAAEDEDADEKRRIAEHLRGLDPAPPAAVLAVLPAAGS